MRPQARSPLVSLALSSVMMGALHYVNWNLAHAGLLFGFAFAVGVKQPRSPWLWLVILAAGAPAAALVMHVIPGIPTRNSLPVDAASGLVAAAASMLPALGAGVMFRRLRRTKAQASAMT